MCKEKKIAIEKEIVKFFFQKKVRKRVEYELFSKKKRDNAIVRLIAPEFSLEPATMHPIDGAEPDDVIRKLIELGASKNDAYIMNLGDEGQYVTLDEAVNTAFLSGMPVIVYCGNGIGYAQGELEVGPQSRFLLIAQNHSLL